MSRDYDQREDLHALGSARQRPIHGGFQPIETGKPLGPPPTGGSGATTPTEQRQGRLDRLATARADARKEEALARTTPVNAICECCGWIWVVAYLPMPLSIAAALMGKAACPKGCEARVLCKTLEGE